MSSSSDLVSSSSPKFTPRAIPPEGPESTPAIHHREKSFGRLRYSLRQAGEYRRVPIRRPRMMIETQRCTREIPGVKPQGDQHGADSAQAPAGARTLLHRGPDLLTQAPSGTRLNCGRTTSPDC